MFNSIYIYIWNISNGCHDKVYENIVGLLNLFLKAELSPKRYRLGPRSKEVGEEGHNTKHYTVTTRMILHSDGRR